MARPAVHRTFSVDRTYPAPPARVFAAFASRRRGWGTLLDRLGDALRTRA
jgi:hypothetical protein